MESYDIKKLNYAVNAYKGVISSMQSQYEISKMFDGHTVEEYDRLHDDITSSLPGLLRPFKKEDYFSHDAARGNLYYHPTGIIMHAKSNLAIVKSEIESGTQRSVITTPDFSFIKDQELSVILERDYAEIAKALISESWKSVMILSGGAIEAILLDLLAKNPDSLSSAKAPQKDLLRWDLNNLIEVATEEELVDAEVSMLTDSVRNYRNLIHPGKEIRSSQKVEKNEAMIAYHVLEILIRELS